MRPYPAESCFQTCTALDQIAQCHTSSRAPSPWPTLLSRWASAAYASQTRDGALHVPIATGNLNDVLLAVVHWQFVNLRVPYPIGFFTKWAEGRIDDANAGWKGWALWTTYSTRTMFHLEGGKENRPKVVRFQRVFPSNPKR